MASSDPIMQEIFKIWDNFKLSCREFLTPVLIKTWFDTLVPVSFNEETLELKMEIDNRFKYNIITEKYLDRIQDYFSKAMGFDVQIQLICTDTAEEEKPTAKKEQENQEESEPGFSPLSAAGDGQTAQQQFTSTLPFYKFKYTFENFIVGSTNKFAYATCVGVVDRPAEAYNPLFIYGPSGLGKTHLMNAIINERYRRNKNEKIIYIKGDDFTNEMINCLSRQAMGEFREKYRKCDFLLIDDIQFIAGKISTQEEFFHTFEALYENGKQIVMTSDRMPKEITPLEERLRTRFESGIIADIQPPDLELRMAIIKKKAEQIQLDLSEDILTFLAENLRSNIRQIEGAIKKLGAFYFLNGNRAITMDLASSCITELLGGAEPINVTIDKIFSAVCLNYKVSKEDLLSNKRNSNIVYARHIAIYLIRSITEMSYPNIGKIFDKDHTTIIASIQKMEKKILNDTNFAMEINTLERTIRGTIST